ncbi:NAD-dependent epimerase/dehydratase family protein [Streptomyces sp. HSW2009]|uniref:NAD-dependent epimerase/dehydratase family protein n=1 Tax=Streptomyces sp. HSW2009 TaxID=3142890 RepID=UPI0032F08991
MTGPQPPADPDRPGTGHPQPHPSGTPAHHRTTHPATHPTAAGATLVIGATGTTGSRVARRLLALGHPVTAASRGAAAPTEGAGPDQPPAPTDGASPDRPTAPPDGTAPTHGSVPPPRARPVRFDWYDPTTFTAALARAERVYLVPPVSEPDPLPVMLPFLRQARAAGAGRAVLLSSSAVPAGGPAIGQVHAALGELFDTWSAVRPSWFMQNFTGRHPHAARGRGDGLLSTATGTGRVAFVDADDIAAVAVHALTADPPPAADLVVTGPEALSYAEAAAVLSEFAGRPISHAPISVPELRDRLAAHLPPAYAAFLADLDGAIAAGAEDRVTDTVTRLTGRPPRTFRDHLAAHRGALAPLSPRA